MIPAYIIGNPECSIMYPLEDVPTISCDSSEGSQPPLHNPESCNLAVYLPQSMTDSSLTWSNEVCRSSFVHGRVGISRYEECGYALAIVPPDTIIESQFDFTSKHGTSQVTISCSYSVPKSMLALIQLSFAALTLAKSLQGEIAIFGYASFSLSVLPYAVMSLVNLVANMICPHYPTLYMVRNAVMDEAEERLGMRFEGTVGRIKAISLQSTPSNPCPEKENPVVPLDSAYLDQIARKLIMDPNWNGKTSFEQLFMFGMTDDKIRAGLSHLPVFRTLISTPAFEDTIDLTPVTPEDCGSWCPVPPEVEVRNDKLPLLLVPACEDFQRECHEDVPQSYLLKTSL